jgi:hypothetical protein
MNASPTPNDNINQPSGISPATREYLSQLSTARDKTHQKGMFSSFQSDYVPIEGRLTLLSVADSLLKHPARTARELIAGRAISAMFILFVIILASAVASGLIMGSFAGGAQFWKVPVKLTAGILLSALICLPSLYIFTSLSGSKQTLAQTTGLFLQSLALAGILLVGFAPIVWIFSQATSTTVFMGVLHLLFWIISIWFSLELLMSAFSHLSDCPMRVLKIWGLILVVVLLQMSTTLRPLIGKDDGTWFQEKKFFLTHWSDCMENPKP